MLESDFKAVSIAGDKLPTIGMEHNYKITVQNVGSTPQSQYSVKLLKAGGVEVASQEGLPLHFGEEQVYDFIWIPEAGDEEVPYVYGEVLLVGDEYTGNNKTSNLPVFVQAAGTVITHIGNGNDDVVMPYNYLFYNSLSQNLYYSHEMNVGSGYITGIQYVNNFDEPLSGSQISIWMGETDKTNLSQGWSEPSNMQLVFEGTLDFPQGINEVFIPLQTPYLYMGENLVIYSYKEDDQWHMGKVFKNTYDLNSGRSRFMARNDSFDPMNPPEQGSTLTDYLHNIGIYFNISEMASLQGTVTCDNVPIDGVEITIAGSGRETTTDENGEYLFNGLMEGSYSLSFKKVGYSIHVEENVQIEEGEEMILDVELIRLETYTVLGQIKGNDGQSLSMAKIYLSGDKEYSAIADAQGSFEINDVYEGVYDLTITGFAYKTHTQSGISVMNSNEDNYTIDLGEFTLQEVIVPPALLTVELDKEHRDGAQLSWDHNFMGSVLLVDHDASNAYPGFLNATAIIKASLQAHGLYFDLYESSSLPPYNGPSYETMRKYDAVIWVTGEGWAQGQTMTEQDAQNLAQYLDHGGYLLFSGQDYLYDMYPSQQEITFSQGQFAYDYFGLRQVYQDQWWHGDSPTFDYQHASGSQGSFAEGLTLNLKNLYNAKEGLTTDNIIAHGGSPVMDILENPPGVAAIKYENTIFSSASIEAIEDTDARAAFIIKGLNSFVDKLKLKAFNGYALFLDGEEVVSLTQDNHYLFKNLQPNTPYTAGVKSLYTTDESTVKELTFTTYPPTGVSEFGHNLSIYPNPFNDHIIISNAQPVRRVVITNLLGQRVMDVELNGNSTINTESLVQGMYLITLQGENGETLVRRMVKN